MTNEQSMYCPFHKTKHPMRPCSPEELAAAERQFTLEDGRRFELVYGRCPEHMSEVVCNAVYKGNVTLHD